MKKITLSLLLTPLILTSCGHSKTTVEVTTSMFPHYDLVRQIAKNTDLTYSLLIPPGVEVHAFRPSPKQMATISQSNLFFYSSDSIETWVANLSTNQTKVINIHESLFHDDHDHHHDHDEHDDHDEHNEEHHGVHYWTNPDNFILEMNFIVEELTHIRPDDASIFLENATSYEAMIREASERFTSAISGLSEQDIFFVGHNTMEDFGTHFNLHITSLVKDIKPDADITPAQLSALVNAIAASDATHIFTEELAAPTFAITVKNELKAKHNRDVEILELHGYHNVTLQDYDAGVTYLDLLERNFTNLKAALL